ncbi:hypothetical protein RJ639_013629 [Escallonia herrerae]|uniref:Uncharacterized protein n=1 Tax=Escallonia herrerae TaxID=1293975 RepID=A0AA89AM18_9ASTE|nr:hypothetical protein RJ639_013629 [Escallonia herrerae]
MYDPQQGKWDFKARMWELDVPPNQIVAVSGRLFSSDMVAMYHKSTSSRRVKAAADQGVKQLAGSLISVVTASPE